MNWTEEEQIEILAAYMKGAIPCATRVTELVAARGGTMTAEQFRRQIDVLRCHDASRAADSFTRHFAAQGARVAVLEAELEKHRNPRCQRQECARERGRVDALEADLSAARAALIREGMERDELRAQVDAIGKNWEVACRKADEQRERAERLEEELSRVTDRAARLDIALSERTKTHQQAAQERDAALARLPAAPNYSPEHLSGLRAACSELSRAHTRLCEEVNRLLPKEAVRVPHTAGTGEAGRYPCSPACTHDDAATPGHPERVKERSEAFDAANTADAPDACEHRRGDTACSRCAPFMVVHVREERSAAFTEKMAEHQETAEAVAKAREDGVEAMRAACWEAVQEWNVSGRHLSIHQLDTLKAAIEGAAP